MQIENLDVVSTVRDFYMNYAASTITERMFPFIDGLKPVQRRILYSMYDTGVKPGKDTKSARVVGDTMGKYHPHGDSSIYGAICNMSDFYESLNAPLIHGSSLGKNWSDGSSVPAAHQRYTEVSLTPLAEDTYLSGLSKKAVDMVPNYLNDMNEPVLLPVKFPSIIVNSTRGIACGLSSYPPSYTLEGACKGTIALLKGKEISNEDLARELGVIDFPTGGTIGISKKQLVELVETGETRGIYITARYKMLSGNIMHITEIPHNTTIEKIIDQVKHLVVEDNLQGITRVLNATGKLEMAIDIYLKRGVNPEEIFKVLCAFTDLQKKTAFQTKFVSYSKDENGGTRFDLVICGTRELLEDYWIPWRMETMRRMYRYDLGKLKEEAMHIGAWAKIKDHIPQYNEIIIKNKRRDAMSKHKLSFSLTDEEEAYLMDHHAYSYTIDEVEKQLKKYEANLKKQAELNKLIESDELVKQEMVKELEAIIEKYCRERVSAVQGLSEVPRLDKKKRVVSDKEVYVGLTKNFYLKRAETANEVNTLTTRVGNTDKLTNIYRVKNNDKLLVFTTAGYVYKLEVDKIDNGPKSKFRDMIWHLVQKDPADKGTPFYVMPCGDYSGTFTILYNYGEGRLAARKLNASQFKGRNLYKEAFPGFNAGYCTIIKEDKFIIMTSKAKALYVDLSRMNDLASQTKKTMFKTLATMPEGEELSGVLPLSEVAGFSGKEAKFSKKFTSITRADIQPSGVVTDVNDGTIKVEVTRYEGDAVEEPEGPTAEDMVNESNINLDYLLLNSLESDDDDFIDDDDDDDEV